LIDKIIIQINKKPALCGFFIFIIALAISMAGMMAKIKLRVRYVTE